MRYSEFPRISLALNSALNSTANLEEKQGKLITAGNSTEGALLHWLKAGGLDYAAVRRQYDPLYQLHFSSERKRMTTLIRYGNDLLALVKGAPEWVLELCHHFLTADGAVEPLTPEKKDKIRLLLRDAG